MLDRILWNKQTTLDVACILTKRGIYLDQGVKEDFSNFFRESFDSYYLMAPHRNRVAFIFRLHLDLFLLKGDGFCLDFLEPEEIHLRMRKHTTVTAFNLWVLILTLGLRF